MKKITLWKLCSLPHACCYAAVVVVLAFVLEFFFGKWIKLFPEGAIPDYLGVCIAINLGLSFEYVHKSMYVPLRTKIRAMRNSAIAQLEDRGMPHSNLDRDLNRIEKSNEDQCRDYSRLIQCMAYFWAIFGVIALIFEYWVKNIGLPHIVFLLPPVYFYICLRRHSISILKQVDDCLKFVKDIETAETMLAKARKAISGTES